MNNGFLIFKIVNSVFFISPLDFLFLLTESINKVDRQDRFKI